METHRVRIANTYITDQHAHLRSLVKPLENIIPEVTLVVLSKVHDAAEPDIICKPRGP